MARITIEDCLEKVPNKFVLVRMAILRANQLMKGTRPLIDNIEDNREIVLALREIAAGKVKYKEVSEEERRREEKIL
ncbi:DNA-directed RNA polymerase subunit omega [bacterium HR19]|nr:DNA-directed RNA polymerase subunit omega [bacterium HR19]